MQSRSLQRRYHVNFPHHLYSHWPLRNSLHGRWRCWKLHPSSQAWPLLSTSNRGETGIAKCGNFIVPITRQYLQSLHTRLPRQVPELHHMQAHPTTNQILMGCVFIRSYLDAQLWTLQPICLLFRKYHHNIMSFFYSWGWRLWVRHSNARSLPVNFILTNVTSWLLFAEWKFHIQPIYTTQWPTG